MQRGIAVTGLALGLTLSTALVGCTANDGTDGGILVRKNVAAGAGCVTTGMPDEPGIAHGHLNALGLTGYLFIAQMSSRISALAGEESQRTIITKGANIDITFPDSTAFSAAELTALQTAGLTRFRSLFAAPIEPNGGTTDAGFILMSGALSAALLNKAAGAPFALEAVATFTVDGDMAGQRVVSQPFAYPVTITSGGTLPSGGGGINNLGACPLKMITNTGNVCNVFQDGVVDCCTDPAEVTESNPLGFVCPARVSTGA